MQSFRLAAAEPNNDVVVGGNKIFIYKHREPPIVYNNNITTLIRNQNIRIYVKYSRLTLTEHWPKSIYNKWSSRRGGWKFTRINIYSHFSDPDEKYKGQEDGDYVYQSCVWSTKNVLMVECIGILT